MAGEVALDESRRFAAASAFGDAAGDVVAGCRVVLSAVQRDPSAGKPQRQDGDESRR
jgi:hypothetical protein